MKQLLILLISIWFVSAEPPPIDLLPPVHDPPAKSFSSQTQYTSRPFSFKSSFGLKASYPNYSAPSSHYSAPPKSDYGYAASSAGYSYPPPAKSSGYSYPPPVKSSYYRSPVPTSYGSKYLPYHVSYESGRAQASYTSPSSGYSTQSDRHQPWKGWKAPAEKSQILKYIHVHSPSKYYREKPEVRYKLVLVNTPAEEESHDDEFQGPDEEVDTDPHGHTLFYVVAKKPKHGHGHLSQVLRLQLQPDEVNDKILFVKYKGSRDEVPFQSSSTFDYGRSSYHSGRSQYGSELSRL